MAVLSAADQVAVTSSYTRLVCERREAVPIRKAELRAAITAVDAWADSNQASFNSAIPLPARTSLTARQKAEILLFVIRRRWELS